MAAVSTTVMAIAAATAVGSAYTAHRQGQKAADAQKEQARIGQNQAQIEQAGQRRQQIREERVRRAQILQQSEGSGTAMSSMETGSVGALQSVTGANVASSFQADRTSARLGSLSRRAAGAQQRAQTAQAVGQVAGTVFQSMGGAPGMIDAFNTAPGQQPITPYTDRSTGTRNMNRGFPR